MVALCNYREDGVTPYFILWKDGLKGAFRLLPCPPCVLADLCLRRAETKI